jgi:hypothetical protein
MLLYWHDESFRKGEPAWAAAEALACGAPQAALEALEGRRTIVARRWRACAWGALGDVDRVVAEWQAIAKAKGPVLIEYADWFYLPEAGWGRAELWEALHAIGERLDDEGIFPSDPSLERARGFSEGQRAILTFARRAAETSGNVEALQAMCRWRPRWQEAKESLKTLQA